MALTSLTGIFRKSKDFALTSTDPSLTFDLAKKDITGSYMDYEGFADWPLL